MVFACNAAGFTLGLPWLSGRVAVCSMLACCIVYPQPCAEGVTWLEAGQNISMALQLVLQLVALFLLLYTPPMKPKDDYSAGETVTYAVWRFIRQSLIQTGSAAVDKIARLSCKPGARRRSRRCDSGRADLSDMRPCGRRTRAVGGALLPLLSARWSLQSVPICSPTTRWSAYSKPLPGYWDPQFFITAARNDMILRRNQRILGSEYWMPFDDGTCMPPCCVDDYRTSKYARFPLDHARAHHAWGPDTIRHLRTISLLAVPQRTRTKHMWNGPMRPTGYPYSVTDTAATTALAAVTARWIGIRRPVSCRPPTVIATNQVSKPPISPRHGTDLMHGMLQTENIVTGVDIRRPQDQTWRGNPIRHRRCPLASIAEQAEETPFSGKDHVQSECRVVVDSGNYPTLCIPINLPKVTVEAFKEEVSRRTGCPTRRFLLLCNAKLLHFNKALLRTYNVSNNSTIQMVVLGEGGGAAPLITTQSVQRMMSLDSVSEARNEWTRLTNIAREHQTRIRCFLDTVLGAPEKERRDFFRTITGTNVTDTGCINLVMMAVDGDRAEVKLVSPEDGEEGPLRNETSRERTTRLSKARQTNWQEYIKELIRGMDDVPHLAAAVEVMEGSSTPVTDCTTNVGCFVMDAASLARVCGVRERTFVNKPGYGHLNMQRHRRILRYLDGPMESNKMKEQRVAGRTGTALNTQRAYVARSADVSEAILKANCDGNYRHLMKATLASRGEIQDMLQKQPLDKLCPSAGGRLQRLLGVEELCKEEQIQPVVDALFLGDGTVANPGLMNDKIPDVSEEDARPLVMAGQHSFSEPVHAALINHFSQLAYCKTEHQDGYVRLVCRTSDFDTAYMKIGDGKSVASTWASDVEVALLDIATEVLDRVYDIINENATRLGFQDQLTRQPPNSGHVKIGKNAGGSYGYHNDGDALNVSTPEDLKITEGTGDALPLLANMIVLTFVLAERPCSKAEVSWRKGTKTVGRVVTGHNSFHLQLVGAQADGYEHGSTIVKGTEYSRVIFTARRFLFSGDDKFEACKRADVSGSAPYALYNYTNVLCSSVKGAGSVEARDKIIVPLHKFPKVSVSHQTKQDFAYMVDKTKNTVIIDEKEYQIPLLFQQNRTTSMQHDPRFKHLACHSFIKEMLKQDCLIETSFPDGYAEKVQKRGRKRKGCKDGEGGDEPIEDDFENPDLDADDREFHQFLHTIGGKLLIPGDKFDIDKLGSANFDAHQNKKAQYLIRGPKESDLITGFVASRPYKNVPSLMGKSKTRLDEWREKWDGSAEDIAKLDDCIYTKTLEVLERHIQALLGGMNVTPICGTCGTAGSLSSLCVKCREESAEQHNKFAEVEAKLAAAETTLAQIQSLVDGENVHGLEQQLRDLLARQHAGGTLAEVSDGSTVNPAENTDGVTLGREGPPNPSTNPDAGTEVIFPYDGILRVDMGGGSAALAGAFPKSARNMASTDATTVADTSQKDTKDVEYLFKACARGHVFPVFQRLSTWGLRKDEHQSQHSKQDMYFHGYFRVGYIEYGPLSDSALRHRFVGNGWGEYFRNMSSQQYTTFLSSAHYEVVLVPVFDGNDYKKMFLRHNEGIGEPFRKLSIPAEDYRAIQCEDDDTTGAPEGTAPIATAGAADAATPTPACGTGPVAAAETVPPMIDRVPHDGGSDGPSSANTTGAAGPANAPPMPLGQRGDGSEFVKHKNVLERYIARGDWEEYIRTEDGAQQHIPMTDKELHSFMVDANDICNLMFHTEMSVAMRATEAAGLHRPDEATNKGLKYMPLTTTKGGSAASREELEMERLLVFLMNSRRIRPIPSICRATDVNVHYLDCAVQEALPDLFQADNLRGGGAFWDVEEEERDAMLEVLFMALFNRIMGRVSSLEGYREQEVKKGSRSSASKRGIPRRSEIESFLLYLDERVGASSVGPAMNAQHSSHIPPKLKEVNNFKSFIRSIANHGLERFKTDLLDPAIPPTRERAVELFSKVILYAYDSSEQSGSKSLMTKINFLSHHSLADCEEFFGDAFGEVSEESVHEGYGGREGHHLCKGMDEENAAKPRFMTKKEAFDELVGVLLTKSEHFLSAVSIVKRDDGILCWKKRGRPLNLTDFEHICCKIWLNCRGRYASHTISDNPKPYNHYCWMPPAGGPGFRHSLQEHYQGILNAAKYVLTHGSVPSDGTAPLTRSCFPVPPENYLFDEEYDSFYGIDNFWTFRFADGEPPLEAAKLPSQKPKVAAKPRKKRKASPRKRKVQAPADTVQPDDASDVTECDCSNPNCLFQGKTRTDAVCDECYGRFHRHDCGYSDGDNLYCSSCPGLPPPSSHAIESDASEGVDDPCFNVPEVDRDCVPYATQHRQSSDGMSEGGSDSATEHLFGLTLRGPNAGTNNPNQDVFEETDDDDDVSACSTSKDADRELSFEDTGSLADCDAGGVIGPPQPDDSLRIVIRRNAIEECTRLRDTGSRGRKPGAERLNRNYTWCCCCASDYDGSNMCINCIHYVHEECMSSLYTPEGTVERYCNHCTMLLQEKDHNNVAAAKCCNRNCPTPKDPLGVICGYCKGHLHDECKAAGTEGNYCKHCHIPAGNII